MRRVLRPGATAAATVWDNYGGMPRWRLFWDTIVALEPEAAGKRASPRRPMTGEGELRAAFESTGFARVAATMLAIRMDYTNFDDFWRPMVYGQGTFGSFFDALLEARRDRLRDAVRAAYLAGDGDGPRGFASVAWAVRGTARCAVFLRRDLLCKPVLHPQTADAPELLGICCHDRGT